MRLLAALLLLLPIPACPAQVVSAKAPHADAAATAPEYPVEADLVTPLDARHAHIGDPLTLRLDRPWSHGACNLPRAAAITGRIAALTLRSPQQRETELAVTFSAPCGTHPAQPLTWIALLAPDEQSLADLRDGNTVVTPAFRSASFGESGGLGASTPNQSNHGDLSGRQNPDLPIATAPPPEKLHPRPSAVRTGEVWRLPELTLHVAALHLAASPAASDLTAGHVLPGAQEVSVLSSSGKTLRLPKGSIFILKPAAFANGASTAKP